MKRIASARNPAVQRCRALRDAAGRREAGLAVAEGFKVLREALLSEVEIVDVFLSERALRLPGAEDLVARLEAGSAAGHWACYEVPGDLLERIASTENPQGAVAVFRPRAHALEAVVRAGDGPLLLLDRVADPGNLGLILRTAEAAGAAGVILSPGAVDPLNPKAVRASAGSVFRLPVARAPIDEAAAAAEGAGYRLYATSPREGRGYAETDLAGKVGFLLGQEGEGLAAGLLGRFAGLHIPTGRVESLNVAMAAGILLYEALRQRRLPGA